MNTNRKLLLIPIALFFLSVVVSASSITTSIYYNSTTQKSLQIQDGQSFGLVVSADSVLESNMNINVVMLDSSGDLVANLLSVYTTKDSYSDYLTIGLSAYKAIGNYTIVSTATAASGQTATSTLSLQVLTVPVNNPPVITSVPVTQVNETQNYLYQVTATDANGDPLTYSLIQGPSWLSMNPAGLVSGIAPSVNSDTQYAVTVGVSDGKSLVTQAYTLTVKYVSQIPNTNPPIITVISPSNNQIFNGSSVPFSISTNENVSGAWYILDNGANVSMTQTSATTFMDSVPLLNGSHSVFFYAKDLSGNIGKSSLVSFSVNTTNTTPDTTPPVINITSPVNGGIYPVQVTSINYTVSDPNLASCWYSLNGSPNITTICNTLITGISSVNGTNTWTVYANDTAGNLASATVTFTINPSNPNGNDSIVITSNPINSVNQQSAYNYQVTATDNNNYTLTYSLTQAPSWLSIDPSTGLITGISPSVNSNTDFSVTVFVSDRITNNTQSYVLTVTNNNNQGTGSGGVSGNLNNNSDFAYQNQQYLNQFAPKTAVQAEEQTTPSTGGLFGSGLGWVVFILIIVLVVMVIWIISLFLK